MLDSRAVLEALRGVRDPAGTGDVVTLGLVRDVVVDAGAVSFTLAFTTEPPAARASLHGAATRVVEALPGVATVKVRMTGSAPARPAGGGHAHGPAPGPAAPQAALIPGVRHTLAVSSGKGGVGKSTVAVNLAVALAAGGARVGLVDADVYGPDVPMMLGTRGRPAMVGNRIVPVESCGLRVMSLGLLVGDREPLVWRGPMIHSFLQQMLRDVDWGPLEYLVFDMPPGTGDAQLSLSQVIPLGGVVMVTTPQDVALLDVRKAVAMFQRLNVPLLGIVENMSDFACPHCGQHTSIFGARGGRRLAEEYGVPLLGEIPLDSATREAGDAGQPVTLARPDSAPAAAFRRLADDVGARLTALAPLSRLPDIG